MCVCVCVCACLTVCVCAQVSSFRGTHYDCTRALQGSATYSDVDMSGYTIAEMVSVSLTRRLTHSLFNTSTSPHLACPAHTRGVRARTHTHHTQSLTPHTHTHTHTHHTHSLTHVLRQSSELSQNRSLARSLNSLNIASHHITLHHIAFSLANSLHSISLTRSLAHALNTTRSGDRG